MTTYYLVHKTTGLIKIKRASFRPVSMSHKVFTDQAKAYAFANKVLS